MVRRNEAVANVEGEVEVQDEFTLMDWLRVGLGIVLASQVMARWVTGEWLWFSFRSDAGKGNERPLAEASSYWREKGYELPHVFSLEELSEFRGSGNRGGTPIVVAINGTVFDVSSARRFYGPHGPYKKYTGTDCSNNFQYGMFDVSLLYLDRLACDWHISDLTEKQSMRVREWHQYFEAKYPTVGSVSFPA